MSHPWNWLEAELSSLEDANLRRARRCVTPLPEGRCRIGEQSFWNFAGNDYLGLAGDSRLAEAAARAMSESGVGSRASALVTGRTIWHERLEQRLAQFKETETAILFPTGYAANVGTITALAGSEDVVYCDRLNHASLVDGCRLSRAKFQVYPHNDVVALRRELAKRSSHRRRLIITDSLFSMDGDAAPLLELSQLAEEFDAFLIVDEAHATGICGEQGTGLLEEQGIHSDRVVNIGTLSKALGAQGGFVTGSRALCDWLWNSARMQMFSTALAIPVCAAGIAAIELIQTEPHRRQWLRQASEKVQTALREQGWNVPHQLVGPILPILIGEPETTLQLGRELEQQGVLAATIRPPTVPKGTSRLRLSLSYAHGDAGVEALLRTFSRLHCPVN